MPPTRLFNPPIVTAEKLLTAYLKTQTRQYLTLKRVAGISLPKPISGKDYTLYAHVPYCESLCPYCSFNRFVFKEANTRAYFSALRTEMKMIADLGYQFKTVYFGGGTPTILLDELVQTIDLARSLFPITEVSCETNPNHLIPAYVDQLEKRVQRLSVGVQSFDDTLLGQMNRLAKFGNGEEILERIRFAAPHFESLNVDMIFNFPNQTAESLKRDLEMIIDSGTQQVTFYPLMSSRSVEKSMANSIGNLTHDNEWHFFNIIYDALSNEFQQLSAWTFVRKTTGMIDEYIVDSENYVGIGSGSFSYIHGNLFVNTFSTKEYIDEIKQGKSPVNARQEYKLFPRMRYWFLMNLFGMKFSIGRFYKTFKRDLFLSLPIEMTFMHLLGAFRDKEYHLTRKGQYLSLVLMREFFAGVNNFRDTARKALSPEELADQCADLSIRHTNS
jgi:coproporphyrinogen III oxidase-like Fe-S oxidoreductase